MMANQDYTDTTPFQPVDKNKSTQQIMKFYNEHGIGNRLSKLADPLAGKFSENRESSFIGLFFEDKLKSLKKQEEKALYEDDFDQLKKVRTAMKSIMKACQKLNHLTAKKTEAINNEDYETAQMIKNEMNKIQKTIMSSNDRNNSSTLSKGRGATLSPIEFRNKAPRPINISKAEAMKMEDAYGTNTNSHKNLNPLSLKTVRRKENLPKLDNDIFAPKRKIGLEERALPALGRETPLDF
jgi:hypothetical protein